MAARRAWLAQRSRHDFEHCSNVRDRWILALGVALLAAVVVLLIGLLTEQLALWLISLGCLVIFTIAVSWLMLVKKEQEQSGKQALG